MVSKKHSPPRRRGDAIACLFLGGRLAKADMVEVVVAANRLDSRRADTVRAALWMAGDEPALAA